MVKATNKVQGLLSTSQRVRLVSGEDVELHLDSGEVFQGTLASLRSRSSAHPKITTRSKTWSRWQGTPDDLVQFLRKAIQEVGRSGEPPPISVKMVIGDDDEERYFEVESFEQDIRSQESGTPGARLGQIRQIETVVGPTQQDSYKATTTFSSVLPAPGVVLAMEGADRRMVGALKDELATLIDAGRPRMPALNGLAQMIVGGLLGIAYAFGLFSINWNFLPDGWIGSLLFALLYLAGFIALLYAYSAGIKLLLPPLTIRRAGEPSPRKEWGKRIGKVVGAVATALLPFMLQQVFGS